MASYVQQEVKDLRDSPQSEGSVTLLLGVAGSMEPVREFVSDIGGEVDEELPFDTLRVVVPVSSIDQLCEYENLTSLEIEEEGRTLSSGNFKSQ